MRVHSHEVYLEHSRLVMTYMCMSSDPIRIDAAHIIIMHETNSLLLKASVNRRQNTRRVIVYWSVDCKTSRRRRRRFLASVIMRNAGWYFWRGDEWIARWWLFNSLWIQNSSILLLSVTAREILTVAVIYFDDRVIVTDATWRGCVDETLLH